MGAIATKKSSPVKGQSTHVYDGIRKAIIGGQLAPLQKLKIQELATQYGVSPGAVREALSRLTSQQFVVAESNKGFVVSPVSLDDLQDLTELRCVIEELAIRKSLQNGTREWEASVLAAAHILDSTPALAEDGENVLQDWIDAHAHFHFALVSACNSPRLLALHSQLYEQSERYRLHTAPTSRQRDIKNEHKQIAELAIQRQEDKLVEKLTQHIERTTALIISMQKKG